MAKKKTSTVDITKIDVRLTEIQENKANVLESIKVNIKANNEKQKLYKKYLKDNSKQIVFGSGSPGTGKSFLSLAYALKALKDREFDTVRILIPTCEASSKLALGFLPGDLESKIQPYKECSLYNIAKVLEKSGCMDSKKIASSLVESGKIDFELISYIRGKTFDNTLILVEEAENLSPEELLLVMTRIGENSKLVISGDPRQADRAYLSNRSGLEHAIERLKTMEEVALVEFTDEDIVRNTLITKILKNW